MLNNSEVLKGFVSIVTFDSKSCQFCVKMSTKVFKLTDAGPIWHIGCRCFRAPQVKTWKELGFDNIPEYPTGTRATSTGPVKADLSFNDWLKTQPQKTANELLGPVRGKMFAEGKLKLDKFTDNSGKQHLEFANNLNLRIGGDLFIGLSMGPSTPMGVWTMQVWHEGRVLLERKFELYRP